MIFNTGLEELEVNPFISSFVEGLLGTYFWNFHKEQVIGPMNKKELEKFTANKAELIDFDTAIQKLKGHNVAQVFRNHRFLRTMGLLRNGRYVHSGRGAPEAA